MKEIKRGIYKHYKNKLYELISIARHSETLEEFVVYQALYEKEFAKEALWIRPKAMFIEEVEFEGRKMPRFIFIGEKNENTT